MALEIREKLKAGGAAAGGGRDAAVADRHRLGHARGTFKYVGTPPTPGKLNVDKDTEVCGKGMGMLDNSLVVGSDGGIANIVRLCPGQARARVGRSRSPRTTKPRRSCSIRRIACS